MSDGGWLIRRLGPVLIAAGLLLASPGSAAAAGKTFVGTVGEDGSDWEKGDNWQPAGVPASTDTVSSNYPICVHTALTVEAAWTLSGVNGGGLGCTGSITVLNGGSLNLSSAGLSLAGGVTVQSGGTLSFGGGVTNSLQTSLTNDGSVVISGEVSIASGKVVRNNASLSIERSTSGRAISTDTTASVENHGVVTKKNANQASITRVRFTNAESASVVVQQGTLQFASTENPGVASNGSFDVAADATLEFNSSSLSVDAGGQLVGAGLVRFVSGSDFTPRIPLNVNNLEFAGNQLDCSANLDILGRFEWKQGGVTTSATGSEPGRVTIRSGKQLDLSTDAQKHLQRCRLDNLGTATWHDGELRLDGGAVLENKAGGSFELKSDRTVSSDHGAQTRLVNGGSLQKTAGSGVSLLDVVFNNTGQVTVKAGQLHLSTGESTGLFSLISAGAGAAPGELHFIGGTYTLAGPPPTGGPIAQAVQEDPPNGIDGDGVAKIRAGGILAIRSSTSAKNVELNNGRLDGPGELTIGNLFDWLGGTIQGNGKLSIGATATLKIRGAAGKTLVQRTVENRGTATWTGTGGVTAENGAVFNNRQSFTVQNDRGFGRFIGAKATFNNFGTLVKKDSTGSTTLTLEFNNTGSVDVQSGNLDLSEFGGTSDGTFQAAQGSKIRFLSGTPHVLSGARFDGDGFASVVGGTVDVRGAVFAKNLELLEQAPLGAGTIDGTGTLTIGQGGGTFRWTGGKQTGSGTTVVSPEGALSIEGTALKLLDQRKLLNQSARATWSGTGDLQLANGATFTNQGTVEDGANAAMIPGGASGARFVNEGTYVRASSETANSLIRVPFTNNGLLHARDGALTLLGGGGGSGEFRADQDESISFKAERFDLIGARFSGAGHNIVAGATLVFKQVFSAVQDGSSLVLLSGLLAGSTDPCTAGSAPSLAGPQSPMLHVDSGGTMEWNSGDLRNLSLAIAMDGTLHIVTSAPKLMECSAVENNGLIRWTRAVTASVDDLRLNGSLIDNGIGATFRIETDGGITQVPQGIASLIRNHGLLVKTAGQDASGTRVAVPLEVVDEGTVRAEEGAIRLLAGGSSSEATFDIAAQALIAFAGGEFLAHDGTTYVGAGYTELAGGLLTMPDGGIVPIKARNFKLSGGTLGGFGTLEVVEGGDFWWAGGTIKERLDVEVGAGATLRITGTGGSPRNLQGGTITNEGTVRWIDGDVQSSPLATVKNSPGALFEILADATWRQSGSQALDVRNRGTIRKIGPSETTTLDADVSMDEGLIDLRATTLKLRGLTQTGGETRLRTATLGVARPLRLDGGKLVADGRIDGSLVNNAVVKIGGEAQGLEIGRLVIGGEYAQGGNVRLELEVTGNTPGLGFDQLVIEGGAHLNGTLAIVILPGNLSLQNGDTLPLIKYPARSSPFAKIEGGSGQLGGLTLALRDLPTELDLVVSGAAEADLVLTKTDLKDPVRPGEEIEYLLTVVNNGPSRATGVSLVDVLPTGVTFISAEVEPISLDNSRGCTGNGPIACALGELSSAGPNREAKVRIVVKTSAAGQVVNVATVTAVEQDKNPSNNVGIAETTTVSNGSANLAISKRDAPDPVREDGRLEYTIQVVNRGPDVATGVIVEDTLPGSAAYDAAASSVQCAAAGQKVTCAIGTLQLDEAAAVTIVVKPNVVGTIVNQASVRSEQGDPDASDNTTPPVTTEVVVGACKPPRPKFTAKQAKDSLGVTFQGKPGIDKRCTTLQLLWRLEFPTTAENIRKNVESFFYAYKQPGSYQVVFDVVDSEGNAGSTSRSVRVKPVRAR